MLTCTYCEPGTTIFYEFYIYPLMCSLKQLYKELLLLSLFKMMTER